jgi:hypothetical protein
MYTGSLLKMKLVNFEGWRNGGDEVAVFSRWHKNTCIYKNPERVSKKLNSGDTGLYLFIYCLFDDAVTQTQSVVGC